MMTEIEQSAFQSQAQVIKALRELICALILDADGSLSVSHASVMRAAGKSFVAHPDERSGKTFLLLDEFRTGAELHNATRERGAA